MKRILILVTAFMLLSVQGFSQFGIKGGLNFNSLEDINLKGVKDFDIGNSTGFNAGILYKVKIPLVGLAIQPELIYSQTNSSINTEIAGWSNLNGDLKIGTLMLPVGLQWGIDLMLFRPFIQAVPYIGYTVNTQNKITNLNWNVDKFKYGVGLGAGLDIWKLQISGRYNWDLGDVAEFEWKGVDTFKGGKNKGFELSLAILF
jgi:hypothetical protein